MSTPNPLAGYEDWPDAVRSAPTYDGVDDRTTALGRLLGVVRLAPTTVVEEGADVVDGVEVRRLRWSVATDPRSRPGCCDPPGWSDHCPGCSACTATAGCGRWVASSWSTSAPSRDHGPGCFATAGTPVRAPANALARRGFAVLVHDTFSWGSRRFDLSRPSDKLAGQLAAYDALWREQGREPDADERFDLASGLHEETVAKAAGTLGQTFTGAVLSDDLVALDVLASRPDVDADRLATFGFSGGGARSLLLAALDHRVGAAAVSCMMATFASLVPTYLDHHSWLLNAPGLWSFADWPDLTGLAAARWLVQYRRADPLFPLAGMTAAHDRLTALHPRPGRYRGTFGDGGHAYDVGMQQEVEDFLRQDTPGVG